MKISKLKQAILVSLALLIALLFLASGSFYLYLKIQGKSPEHFVNQGIEFLTSHIPLVRENKIELRTVASVLELLPADSKSYQEIQINLIPQDLQEIVTNYLSLKNPADSLPETVVVATFPFVNQGTESVTQVFFVPYLLAEEESLLNKIFHSFEDEAFEVSSEIFSGYETYLLSQAEGLSYYLCRISSNYLLLTENKQALAKILRQQTSPAPLSEKLLFGNNENTFYKSFQEGNSNNSFFHRIERLSNFYASRATKTEIYTDTKALKFKKELELGEELPEILELKLASFSPKETLLYFEAYDLSKMLYPIFESSTSKDGTYKIKAKDIINDFRNKYNLDLEQDLLEWMNHNYSLSVTPVSSSGLFTYVFSLLVEIDEKEEALLGLEKTEQAIENYLTEHKPTDLATEITYKFIDQNLGDLQLRSIAIYPEFGFHYTLLDDNHLLLSTHLEGIEDFGQVRPDKDSLATRNAFTRAIGDLSNKKILNVFYWDVKESFDFVNYLLGKYLANKEATFTSNLLSHIESIGQVSELKSNYIEQTGIINF